MKLLLQINIAVSAIFFLFSVVCVVLGAGTLWIHVMAAIAQLGLLIFNVRRYRKLRYAL